MAVVVVLVGQCGNQLGDELFTQLALCAGQSPASAGPTSSSSSSSPSASPFFSRDGMARCVLVDTEPKVVLGVRQRHADVIRAENVVHGQSGRGNNWGLGYYGVKTALSRRNEDNAAVTRAFRNIAKDQREEDDNVLGRALQAIYRETRRTSDVDGDDDTFEAMVIVHSLVGGTGSGLASRLTERLRLYFTEPPAGQRVDEVYEATMMRIDGFDGGLYGAQRRARHLVNIAVAPQVVGEVATQGLNAALTLQVLQKHSDAVVLLRNDDAMAPGDGKGSSSVCAGTSVLSRCVTFKEANEVLVALLLPVLSYGVAAGCITRLVEQCVPPAYRETTGGNKVLTLLPTPQRSYGLLRQCVHRGLFCAVGGGRAFMPGYQPTVPVEELLSRTAQRLWRRQPRHPAASGVKGSAAATKTKPPVPTRRAQPTSSTSSNFSAGRQQQQQQQPPQPSHVRSRFSSDAEDPYEDAMEAQRRLSGRPRRKLGFRSGDESGLVRPALATSDRRTSASGGAPSTSVSGAPRRRPPMTPFSSPPERTRPRVQQQQQQQQQPSSSSRPTSSRPLRTANHPAKEVDLSFDRDMSERDDDDGDTVGQSYSVSCAGAEVGRDGDGDDSDAEDNINQRVYLRCNTTIPQALFRHYQQLRRAPVTKMFETIDGVLVMNQAVELDGKVLFPLLRSAALKVSSGAFMSSYEDVGVTSERVKRAVRDVAEIMANSEEL